MPSFGQPETYCGCKKFRRCAAHAEPPDALPDDIPTVCICGGGFKLVSRDQRVDYYECGSCQLPVHRRMR